MILALIILYVVITIQGIVIYLLHEKVEYLSAVIAKIPAALQVLRDNQETIHSDVKKTRYEQIAKKKVIRK